MFKNLFRPRSRAAPPGQTVKDTTPAELNSLLQAHQPLVVLDVRTAAEYAHDGHIAGARLMPLAMVPARKNELPRDMPIVCVCRSGARSLVACEALKRQGFNNVSNMGGGMVAWQQAGLPVR